MQNVITHPNFSTAKTAATPKAGIFGTITLWRRLWGERRELSKLDARMLADIGLDADAARREASRAPWDVPVNRARAEVIAKV